MAIKSEIDEKREKVSVVPPLTRQADGLFLKRGV